MRDEHLNTIPETEKSSVENLVPIPSEFEGISEDICDVPSCDHFDEFASELDLIDPILSRIDGNDCDEDDFDEEEGEIDIFQVEDEILHEKLLNVNLLIDKIEALNLNLSPPPSIPFEPKYPPSTPIPVVDSAFSYREVDYISVSKDSDNTSIAPTLWILLYFSPPGVKTPFLTPASPPRASGISSGWNFHVL
ncbi:hypothetical protein Tco_0158162 [Tanacetum coccineum]